MKFSIGQLVKLTTPSPEFSFMKGCIGCIDDRGVGEEHVEYIVDIPEYKDHESHMWLIEEFRLSPIDDSDNRTASEDILIFNPAEVM